MSVYTDAQALIARTTTAQEISQQVEDPAVIGRVAALLCPNAAAPREDEGPGTLQENHSAGGHEEVSRVRA